MADHSVSHLSVKVSVLTVKPCIYFYTLLMWSSCYNTAVTGQHQVIGSSQDILVKEGDDVILPCHIEPPVNMRTQSVEWSRPDLKSVYVFLLKNGHYNNDVDLNPLYRQRTSLFPEKLPGGNMSLKLSRVKLSDEGKFRCSAPLQNNFTFIQLLVGSVSHPVITSNGPTDGGVSLSCDSGCWYPQPEMSWLDGNENNISAEPSVIHRPSPHCYDVQRNVTVRGANNVTCRVHLPHINYTVNEQRYISERDIHTEKGSAGSVIAGIFTLIIILVAAGLGYLYWKKKKHPDVKRTRDEEMAPLNPADQPITYPDIITNDEEIRIVLVGKTGAGKSATGNTILGPEVFKSTFSPDSVTQTCNKASGVVDGRKVSVIDTPGLFDTGFSNTETIKEVRNCITCAAPGPHVFLAVIKLGRFTDEERNVVAKIQEAFGQSSDKYTMILFTHGDKLKDQPFDEFVNDSPELQELISKYSGFYHVFNNESKDPFQVTELLGKINQMVKENGGSHYTNQMFQEEARRQGNQKSPRWRQQLERLENIDDSEVIKVGSFVIGKSKEFLIGQGNNGTEVFLGLTVDGIGVAVKKMTYRYAKALEDETIFSFLPKLVDHSIVQYVDFAKDDNFGYLALQLFEYNLKEYIKEHMDKPILSKLQRKQLAHQVLQSLRFLHFHNPPILHGDLKPQNVLIDTDGNARLADFGMIQRPNNHSSESGKRCWMATEMLLGEAYTIHSDIQVAGMLIYYILSGRGHPFGENYITNIGYGNYNLDRVQDVKAKHLIEWMINADPEKRPTVEECLDHPFFWSNQGRVEYLRTIGNQQEVVNPPDDDLIRALDQFAEQGQFNTWKHKFPPELVQKMDGLKSYPENSFGLLHFINNLHDQYAEDAAHIDLMEMFPGLVGGVYKFAQKQDWNSRPALQELIQREEVSTSSV